MNNVHINRILNDYDCFLSFKEGNENALALLYDNLSKPLFLHGLKIIQDRFEVNSVIQEAFLKAWNFRERLTSILHTYRFLRMNVTWKCYNYYRQPGIRHHRIIYTDNIDHYASSYNPNGDCEPTYRANEEMLKAIYDVIPYLPADRQTILTLYFKYGLSYKEIAKRFATSNQAVSIELQRGLEHLKKVIHTKKKLDIPVRAGANQFPYNEILEGELLQLFRLRYEKKLPFDTIAAKMNLSQAYVQQQYVIAHSRIQQMTKKRK